MHNIEVLRTLSSDDLRRYIDAQQLSAEEKTELHEKVVGKKASWFQRAKSAVKSVAAKVASAFSRAKSAVVAKVLKTRAVRVMRTIGRWGAWILLAVGTLTALFAAPLMGLLVIIAAGSLWLLRHFLMGLVQGAVESLFGIDARLAVSRAMRWMGAAILSVAKFLFGVFATAVFFAIVAASVMTPWGIVDFALMFWLLWTLEAEADAVTPAERAAARSSWRAAQTAKVVSDILRDRRTAVA